MSAVNQLMRSAANNHGRSLTPSEVREIAGTIVQYDRQLAAITNLLAAYVNEYGQSLAEELLADDVVEGEVIADEIQEADGFDSQEQRVDAQVEEQEQDTVLEVGDKDERE